MKFNSIVISTSIILITLYLSILDTRISKIEKLNQPIEFSK